MQIKKKNKGIILIEAIIAMAVIVMIMTALITALVSSISSTTFSNEQTLATGYAQEGLEIARGQRNLDFGAFQALDGYYCLSETAIEIGVEGSSCSNNVGSSPYFTRKIYVNQNGVDNRTGGLGELKCEQSYVNQATGNTIDVVSFFVASIVTWSDSRCDSSLECHKVDLNTCLVNLNYISTP